LCFLEWLAITDGSLRSVLSLDTTTIETAKINLSVLQQTETGRGINIAGCLVAWY
jgi:hypothetical protein